ncbi:LuxR C-terminal-related transcriptional regulator [Kribbella sp. NBC_01505]|uniref:helix-turn-helix transcriptional regulator n=1 Tax=Kribbella sp. NBC_01505 TaxID=2903580 RepID=UPI00386EA14B
MAEFAAAGKVQAGAHALTQRLAAGTIVTQVRAGLLDHAAALRALESTDILTRIEVNLLAALNHCDLGDQRAATTALEQALDLAEQDRLILPFLITGAWKLLKALPAWETAHAALIADILDAVHGEVPRADPLSPGELRVLRYLPTNLTRPEIAGELLISLNTVSTHIRSIYAKPGATDRTTAVQRARALRLLSSRP